MKKLFIDAKVKSLKVDEKIFHKLKGKVGIIYSLQFEDCALEAKKILSGSVVLGQVLGCNASNALEEDVDCYLFLGGGRFHALRVVEKTGKDVYVFDGESCSKVSKKELEKFEKRKKGLFLKFLRAKKVGILVSLKPGQENFSRSLKFLKSLKDKEGYIFLMDEIDLGKLEDFKDIECWVNTACPRIEGVLNLEDIENNIKE